MGSISANRTAKRHLRTCFMYMSTLFQCSVRKVPRARLSLIEKSLRRRRWRRSAGRSGRKFKGDRRVWLTIFLVPGDIFRKRGVDFFSIRFVPLKRESYRVRRRVVGLKVFGMSLSRLETSQSTPPFFQLYFLRRLILEEICCNSFKMRE